MEKHGVDNKLHCNRAQLIFEMFNSNVQRETRDTHTLQEGSRVINVSRDLKIYKNSQENFYLQLFIF